MATYYLLLEKITRRLDANEIDAALRVLETLNSEYDQNKREMYHQRLCDYAYGEEE